MEGQGSRGSADSLQPKIRSQITEALQRQFQMTQLSQQAGSKADTSKQQAALTSSPRFGVFSSVPSSRRPMAQANAPQEPRVVMPVQTCRKYSLVPPTKRQLAPGLGYADFYPQSTAQTEDLLSEAHIRHGYVDKPLLANETLSAQDLISDLLRSSSGVGKLGAVGETLIADTLNNTDSSGRKSPRLEKMEEWKREQWFLELADPRVPLGSLADRVPSDVDDAALLSMLSKARVPLARASWCVKTIVGSEMALSLLVENSEPRWRAWVKALRRFLALQLDRFADAKEGPIDPLAEHLHPKLIDAIESWTYATKLMQWQCSEGLVPRAWLLKWAVQRFQKANELQTYLLLPVVADWLPTLCESRRLLFDVIDAALQRLGWLSRLPQDDHDARDPYRNGLCALVQAAVLCEPEVLNARQWRNTCDRVVDAVFSGSGLFEVLSEDVRADCVSLLAGYRETVARRNQHSEASDEIPTSDLERKLMILDLPPEKLPLSERYKALFSSSGHSSVECDDAWTIATICQWAVTQERTGRHRPYMAALLVLQHVNRVGALDVQAALTSFLETHKPAFEEEERQIAVLFGELIRTGIFSYSLYLQRLVGKGLLRRGATRTESSEREVRYLRMFPIPRTSQHLRNHRRFCFSEDAATHSERVHEMFRDGLAGFLSGTTSSERDDGAAVLTVASLEVLDRYDQIRLGDWVLDLARSASAASGVSLDFAAPVIGALEMLSDYSGALEACLCFVEQLHNLGIVHFVVECVERNLAVFMMLDRFGRLCEVLANSAMQQPVQTRDAPTVRLLMRVAKLPDYKFLHEKLSQFVYTAEGKSLEMKETDRAFDEYQSRVHEELGRVSAGVLPTMAKFRAENVAPFLELVVNKIGHDSADPANGGVHTVMAAHAQVFADFVGTDEASLVALLDWLLAGFDGLAHASFPDGQSSWDRPALALRFAIDLVSRGVLPLALWLHHALLPLLRDAAATSDLVTATRFVRTLEVSGTLLWDPGSGHALASATVPPIVWLRLRHQRQQLLETSPVGLLEVLGLLTSLGSSVHVEGSLQPLKQARMALLQFGNESHAIQRDLWPLRDVLRLSFQGSPISPVLREELRQNAAFLLGWPGDLWASDLYSLICSTDTWTYVRVAKTILCKVEGGGYETAADLARAVLEGSVLGGFVSTRMMRRLLCGLDSDTLAAIFALASGKLSEIDQQGLPSFPNVLQHDSSIIDGFLACTLKCAEILGSGRREVPEPARVGPAQVERLCSDLYEQLNALAQQERGLPRLVASIAPFASLRDESASNAADGDADVSALTNFCARLRLRLDLLHHLRDAVLRGQESLRLLEYVKLLLQILAVSLSRSASLNWSWLTLGAHRVRL
ncbi:hypothetical protein DFJ74DRAFT_658048 [Hyaloraphidium curvatum]|nr:hypothetical protein DFJ74DRAFT_658048 [Hyaloraphidium curvatum]